MNHEESIENRKVPFWTSRRLLLALIGFLGTTHLYALRMNMSVAILCMTNNTAVNMLANQSDTAIIGNSDCRNRQGNLSITEASNIPDGPYAWDSSTRGVILGVFFWGYLVTQIPAGILSQKFGPKVVIIIFMFISTIATALTPVGATLGAGFLSFLRVLVGMGSGVWFPCFHHLWSQWAPPLERSKLVGFTYAGIHVGNAITLPIAGLLCQYGFDGGWPSIFYLFGISTFIWLILWGFFAYDGPKSDPRISEAERDYILHSLKGQTAEHKKVEIPILHFAKSLPVWSILVVNVTFDFGGYFFLTSIPTYMQSVLGFDIKENGLLSALPYLGFWSGQILSALLADLFQSKKLLSTTATRKLMTGVGMITPGLAVIALGFLTCNNRYAAVVLLTIGLTANGACFAGIFVNHVDIAPRYAGVMFAVCNSIASVTGFFAPYVVGALTATSTQSEWRIVFFICSACYLFGGIFYIIFASGELQPWASEKPDDFANDNALVSAEDNETRKNLLTSNDSKTEEAV